YAASGGALHVFAEVTRRPAEGAVDSGRYWFITPIKYVVEQIEDKVDDAIRHLRLHERSAIGFGGHLQGSNVSAGRQASFFDRVGTRKPPRTGKFVELAGVAGVAQRSDGNVGDVICIDKRLFDWTNGKRDLAGDDRIQPKVLAEILGEEAAAKDCPIRTANLQSPFCLFRLDLPAAGEKNHLLDASVHGLSEERLNGFQRSGDAQVRIVGHIGLGNSFQASQPSLAIFPIKSGTA